MTAEAANDARTAIDPRAVRVRVAGGGVAPDEPVVVEPAGPDDPPTAALAWLDDERATLVGPTGSRDRVLILPPEPPLDGSGEIRHEVVVGGWSIEVVVESAARAALRERARRGREEAGHSGPTEVRAIIPGVVVSVSVVPGDEVSAGQQLLAVEAMKMQNELRAPRDGVIERVAVGQGTTIEVGDLLLVIA